MPLPVAEMQCRSEYLRGGLRLIQADDAPESEEAAVLMVLDIAGSAAGW